MTKKDVILKIKLEAEKVDKVAENLLKKKPGAKILKGFKEELEKISINLKNIK